MCIIFAGQVVLARAQQPGVVRLPDDHQSLLEGPALKHQRRLREGWWEICLLQGWDQIETRFGTIASRAEYHDWSSFICSSGFCLPSSHLSVFFLLIFFIFRLQVTGTGFSVSPPWKRIPPRAWRTWAPASPKTRSTPLSSTRRRDRRTSSGAPSESVLFVYMYHLICRVGVFFLSEETFCRLKQVILKDFFVLSRRHLTCFSCPDWISRAQTKYRLCFLCSCSNLL